MQQEKISIVIPIYNHADSLSRALISIAAQTYQNKAVILVDDGSVDPVTVQDCAALGIIPFLIVHQKNAGAPAARNRGLQEADGTYVIFWDADVTAPSDFLEKLIRGLLEHPEASYAYTDHVFGRTLMKAQPFDADRLHNCNYIHSTALIRKPDAILWDETLARFQDWDLWLTMLAQKKIGVYVTNTIFFVEPHFGGMSSWLPRFAYYAPFCYLPFFRPRVQAYMHAKKSVQQEHQND